MRELVARLVAQELSVEELRGCGGAQRRALKEELFRLAGLQHVEPQLPVSRAPVAFSLEAIASADEVRLRGLLPLQPCYETVLGALRGIRWPECVSRKNVMEPEMRSIQAWR